MTTSKDARHHTNKQALSSQELLEDWEWLLKGPYTVFAMNNFGDLFLRSKSGEITLLNITWGKLESVAPSVSVFETMITDADKQRQWFQTDLLTQLEQAGFRLGDSQCFSFKKPPALGGDIDVANVEVAPIRVHVSLMGQIHQQLSNLPPGTKIEGVSIG